MSISFSVFECYSKLSLRNALSSRTFSFDAGGNALITLLSHLSQSVIVFTSRSAISLLERCIINDCKISSSQNSVIFNVARTELLHIADDLTQFISSNFWEGRCCFELLVCMVTGICGASEYIVPQLRELVTFSAGELIFNGISSVYLYACIIFKEFRMISVSMQERLKEPVHEKTANLLGLELLCFCAQKSSRSRW